MPKPPNPKESADRPLEPEERELLQRLMAHPMDFPPEFWAGLRGKLEVDPPSFVPSSIASIRGEVWKEVGASGMPAFANAWVNHNAVSKARFYKDALGIVHLGGLIKNGTIGLKAFTLPAGYLPSYTDATPHPLGFAVDSNGAFGTVQVQSNGDVIPAVGNNAWVYLDGINFRTL
jgi:hypothetical protein